MVHEPEQAEFVFSIGAKTVKEDFKPFQRKLNKLKKANPALSIDKTNDQYLLNFNLPIEKWSERAVRLTLKEFMEVFEECLRALQGSGYLGEVEFRLKEKEQPSPKTAPEKAEKASTKKEEAPTPPAPNANANEVTEKPTKEEPEPPKSKEKNELKVWFDALDLTWKRVFKQELDINRTPTLEEIEQVRNLEELDCSSTRILSLEPLEALSKLKKLDFSNTRVKKLNRLGSLAQLEHIDANKTLIQDISPLEGLAALKYLNVSNTKVEECAPGFFERLDTFLYENTSLKRPVLEPVTREKDPLLREAAILTVKEQECSVSFLQRQLKVGYGRAGRIYDQLDDLMIIHIDSSTRESIIFVSEISELNSILSGAGLEPVHSTPRPNAPPEPESKPEPKKNEEKPKEKKGFFKKLFGK